MKAMVCEMCNSNDIQKQDGVYVCQMCGTRYSVEEARKLMIEGVVDVRGTVSIDDSKELQNLYQAARNARETSDEESALKHYQKISAKDPNSWEALFFLAVLKTHSITNGEIASAAVSISNCLPKVFELIQEHVENIDDKKDAIEEVISECYSTAKWLTGASESYYKSCTKGNGMMALTGVGGMISGAASTTSELKENMQRCFRIANIMCDCGNYIEAIFDMNDEDYKSFAVRSWKAMLQFNDEYKALHRGNIFDDETLRAYSETIHQYDSSYQVIEKSGGCYVATAVYGSYDCPQVWTLRRYRDFELASTWYGRAFIHTYYAISPKLVKWFGETKWFKNLWRGRLDRMVAKLQSKGFEDSPYNDQMW